MEKNDDLNCYCCGQNLSEPKASDRGVIYLCSQIDEQELDVLAGTIKTQFKIDETISAFVCKKCTKASKMSSMIGQLQMLGLALGITLISIYFQFVVGVIIVGLYFVVSIFIFLFSIDDYTNKDARDYAVLNKYYEINGKQDDLEYTCFTRSNYFN